eukprot:GHVR01100129.1.p3 GENE.GHVR01100129.1~~GHVR01100129.1.p3  ORF type:complete len:111 (+),score=23.97 GHVR01100129.1:202-534(+)
MRRFCEWLALMGMLNLSALAGDLARLDEALTDYIQYLHDERRPKSEAAEFVAAVQDAFPRVRKALPTAWRVVSAWDFEEPSDFRQPWPLMLVQAMASLAFLLKRADVALY